MEWRCMRSIENQSKITRRELAAFVGQAAACCVYLPCKADHIVRGHEMPLLPNADIEYLRKVAQDTIHAAVVEPGSLRGGQGPNRCGIPLITPGGNYPAFWIRDFAMSLDCGLIPCDISLPMLRLIGRCQQGPTTRRLKSGGVIPAFAIPDHINFDGSAVFYPGTYSAGDDQGALPWGPQPPADDDYYFIHAAYVIWRQSGSTEFLMEIVDGIALLERLKRAFERPHIDVKTGAVTTGRDAQTRTVGFGFQDSVWLEGAMAFATLLRLQAASELLQLCTAAQRENETAPYSAVEQQIQHSFGTVFAYPDADAGWVMAATRTGRQPDVWATLLALHLGVLHGSRAEAALKAIHAAVDCPGNRIEYLGGVRHVPCDRYFSADRCWERGGTAPGTYQSGAFWHTATGWLLKALERTNPATARGVATRYITALRAGNGAPWECYGLGTKGELTGAQNPVYMTSVTVPLSILSPPDWLR